MKFTDRLREAARKTIEFDDDEIMKSAADMIDELEAALLKLAAYDDEWAEFHLKELGSYGWFDSPSAVQIAREALAKLEKLNRE